MAPGAKDWTKEVAQPPTWGQVETLWGRAPYLPGQGEAHTHKTRPQTPLDRRLPQETANRRPGGAALHRGRNAHLKRWVTHEYTSIHSPKLMQGKAGTLAFTGHDGPQAAPTGRDWA